MNNLDCFFITAKYNDGATYHDTFNNLEDCIKVRNTTKELKQDTIKIYVRTNDGREATLSMLVDGV